MKEIPAIDWKRVDLLIDMALEEDLGGVGDVTSSSVVPAGIQARAVLRCKEEGMVMAGQEVAERVFRKLDPSCEYTIFKKDGEVCKYGDIIAEVRGKAQSLLTAERTALNFIQRLCGVATTARKYAIALGDVAFITAPYEMFCSNGLYIKEHSPYEQTMICSCSNDTIDYLADAIGFQYDIYEVNTRRMGAGTAEKVADLYVQTLKDMKNK